MSLFTDIYFLGKIELYLGDVIETCLLYISIFAKEPLQMFFRKG